MAGANECGFICLWPDAIGSERLMRGSSHNANLESKDHLLLRNPIVQGIVFGFLADVSQCIY